MKRIVLGTTVCCALAAATAVTANAQTVLYLGGTGDPFPPTQAQMSFLRHEWAGPDDTLVGVGYPASLIGITLSVDVGVNNVSRAINATSGPETVVGDSQGAIVIDELKNRIMAEPAQSRPAPTDLKFVSLADPDNPRGLLAHIPLFPGLPEAVETPYDTTVVIRQYDGFADFPDRPLNLLATANALMGIVFVHPNYDVDLSTVPTDDITEQTNSLGGKTTTYLVPTEQLPLTEALRMIGVDGRLVDQLDKMLRPIIDSAYNDPPERATANLQRAQQVDDAAGAHADTTVGVASDSKPRVHVVRTSLPRVKADEGRRDGLGATAARGAQANSTVGVASGKKPKPNAGVHRPKPKTRVSSKATSHSKSGSSAGRHRKR